MSESVTGVSTSVSTGRWFRPQTIISTETVTQTGPLTNSVVGTNLPETGDIFSSIPSATATTSSSGSTTLPLALSNPTSTSRFRSHRQSPLGPIVGGVVAVFALILIFIYLVLLLLKRRSSQRHAEIVDPTPTPLDFVDTREGLGRNVSVNDDGVRSEITRVPLARSTVYSSSQIIPPSNVDLRRARTNYTAHSSVHDDMYVTSEYTSNANLQAGERFQSDSSHDLITNGAITEEMTDTPTYIPGQSQNENHIQIDPSDISTICESDYAPPAYHTLPSRNTSFMPVNSPFCQNPEPSIPV